MTVRPLLPVVAALAAAAVSALAATVTYQDWDQSPHRYFETEPRDRFSAWKARFEAGEIPLDRSSEKAFLRSLLRALEIPEASQLWVYSTTSLQLSHISPSNPRAIYFTDDLSVGYIPGGRIEILALDPELGGVFYIFDIPRGGGPVVVERSKRCMNCHAGEDTGFVPGWSVRSVIPGEGGGSLDAFRNGRSGHDIPWAERLGGWHVTGAPGFTNHLGNRLGAMAGGKVATRPLPPGNRFDTARYATDTSDLAAHLVFEHQAGFVNRAVEAQYRVRTILHLDAAKPTPAHEAEIAAQAAGLVRYALFADEAPWPVGLSLKGSPFRAAYEKGGPSALGGKLRELDLETRLYRLRCSPLVAGPLFTGLMEPLRSRVQAELKAALEPGGRHPASRHLGEEERAGIREALRGAR